MWIFNKGETDVTVYVRLRDSTTGLAKTGLAFNSAGAACSQVRTRAARVAITLATQTVTGAHADGGFVEVDATNCKGLYRLDLTDAVCATGVDNAIVSIEFDGIIEESALIKLTSVDLNDAVTGGMSALPNAAADATGGLPISDAGGLDLDAMNTNVNDIETAVVTNAAGADIAADIIALKAETVLIVADTGELQTDWVDGGRLDLLIDAIKVPTDKMVFSTANNLDCRVQFWNGTAVTNSITLGRPQVDVETVADSSTAASNIASTYNGLGYANAKAPATQEQVGTPVGADISADIAAIKAETVLIVADTGELQTDWVNGGRLDLIIDAILLDTGVPFQYC